MTSWELLQRNIIRSGGISASSSIGRMSSKCSDSGLDKLPQLKDIGIRYIPVHILPNHSFDFRSPRRFSSVSQWRWSAPSTLNPSYLLPPSSLSSRSSASGFNFTWPVGLLLISTSRPSTTRKHIFLFSVVTPFVVKCQADLLGTLQTKSIWCTH